MWLTYIIPMYNCEAWIARCLDSLLRQGLDEDEYEIVVVNDGSTDHGAQVVEGYAAAHPGIRLINQPNQGVGAARNVGIEAARGQYVMFIDADDWLLPGGVAQLKGYIDQAAPRDMYNFWSHTVDRHYDPSRWDHITPHRCVFDGTLRDYALAHGFGWSMCMRIISLDLIRRHGLRVKRDLRMGEDLMFMAELFTHDDATVVETDLNIYRYWVHPQSIVNTADAQKNRNVYHGYVDIYDRVSQMKASGQYPPRVYDSVLDDCRRHALLRMASAARSRSDLRGFIAHAQDHGLFPWGGEGRFQRLADWLVGHPTGFYAFSIMYRTVFLRYIKKYIPRN